MGGLRRLVVLGLASADDVIDWVLYRPAIVKAFLWLPRWWQCDLARLSQHLDDRWEVGWWQGFGPRRLCDVCRRRAAWLVVGGTYDEEGDEEGPEDEEDARYHLPEVNTCSWCSLEGEILGEEDLATEVAAAREVSISWAWRWPPRRS